MDDKTFSDLTIKAMICPKQASWPAPEHSHWQRLHEAADTARQSVSTAYSLMATIDADASLSKEGRAQHRQTIAKQALAEIEKSKALIKARDAVGVCQQQWAKKVGESIKPASDIHTATVAAQIRDRIAAMQGSARMGWLEKHSSDPTIASAILTAPLVLSGLTDVELALVKAKAERAALSPEVAEAKDAAEKALDQAERGWRQAINAIGARAGLSKGADGTWSEAAHYD
jgi:chorismate mutase